MIPSSVALLVAGVVGASMLAAGLAAEAWRRRRWLAAILLLTSAVAAIGSMATLLSPLLAPCGLAGCDIMAGVEAARRRTLILDRSGDLIGILEPGRAPWVPLEKIPEHVQKLVIQAEDRRFLEHDGVDPIGVLSALKDNLLRGARRGASTIPMQVAQITVGTYGLQRLRPDGTLRGKMAELVVGARLLERLGHEGVLEIYINSLPMGPVFGFPAASRRELGVPLEEISIPHAATLAAMIRAPSRFSPCAHPDRAEAGRDGLLAALARRRAARLEDVAAWSADPLVPYCAGRGPADDALRAIRDELLLNGDTLHRGDSLRTTIDMEIQRLAWRELDRALHSVSRRTSVDTLQGIAVVLAPDGAIRAWVSGNPSLRARGFDRVRWGRVRTGSTQKPLMLASALERGLVDVSETLSSIDERVPLDARDPWLRRIREGACLSCTVQEALARSDNWAGVLLWRLVPDFEVRRLQRLGWPVGDLTLPSSALGTAALPPLDLTAAYASFANGGVLPRPYLIPKGRLGSTRVWRPTTARSVQEVLIGAVSSGSAWRAGEVVAGSVVRVGGKTGTIAHPNGWSQEFVMVGSREGWGEDLTALLWVGRDHPTPLMPRGTAGEFLSGPWARILAP